MPDLFEVTCPHCDKAYHLSPRKIARHEGARIQCKACDGVFIMPGPPDEAAAGDPGGSIAGAVAPDGPRAGPTRSAKLLDPTPSDAEPVTKETEPGESTPWDAPADPPIEAVPPSEPDPEPEDEEINFGHEEPPPPPPRPTPPVVAERRVPPPAVEVRGDDPQLAVLRSEVGALRRDLAAGRRWAVVSNLLLLLLVALIGLFVVDWFGWADLRPTPELPNLADSLRLRDE